MDLINIYVLAEVARDARKTEDSKRVMYARLGGFFYYFFGVNYVRSTGSSLPP